MTCSNKRPEAGSARSKYAVEKQQLGRESSDFTIENADSAFSNPEAAAEMSSQAVVS